MNIINGKNNSRVVALGANAQIEANMTVVHNILNGGIKVKSNDIVEFELAA